MILCLPGQPVCLTLGRASPCLLEKRFGACIGLRANGGTFITIWPNFNIVRHSSQGVLVLHSFFLFDSRVPGSFFSVLSVTTRKPPARQRLPPKRNPTHGMPEI